MRLASSAGAAAGGNGRTPPGAVTGGVADCTGAWAQAGAQAQAITDASRSCRA
jgi:hypothetical protein